MISSRSSRVFAGSAAFCTLVLAGGVVGFLLWSSCRGLDITDEGYYLLSSQFPQEIKVWPTSSHVYTSLMYNLARGNIVIFRISGLALILGSASLLYYGMFRLLNMCGLRISGLNEIIIAWIFIINGALLYYSWFLPTPSYNLLNAAALNAFTGFFCMTMSDSCRPAAERRKQILPPFGSGLLIAFSFFVKSSTSLLLLAIVLLMLIFWPSDKNFKRLRIIALIASGMIAWALLHFTFLQSPLTWWHVFIGGIRYLHILNAPHFNNTVLRYITEIMILLKHAFVMFLPFHILLFVGLCVLFTLKKKFSFPSIISAAFLLFIFFLAGWKAYRLGFHVGASQSDVYYVRFLMRFYMAFFLLFLSAVILNLIFWRDKWHVPEGPFWRRIILCAVLLGALPFAGAFGTACKITMITIINMAPWFGLLLLQLALLAGILNFRLILHTGILIISMFVFAQVVSSGIIAPYNLNAGIFKQNTATDIGEPSTRLYLDPATSRFFMEIHEIARTGGFKPGDDIIAFCNMPGIVFALGGKSPVMPWYSSGFPGSRRACSMGLSLIPQARLKKAFILQNPAGEANMPDLSGFGLDFPNNYILCGEAEWPVAKSWETYGKVRLWKPINEVTTQESE